MAPRWDKRALRRSVLVARGPGGQVLPAISKVADRGVVWPVLGAVLGVRRATRPAGAAGVGAVLVCSAATGLVKHVSGRKRPAALESLLARGSAERPASSSFPSTHAGNAFAFAAAASCVRPVLGIPLVPTAVAICAARVAMAHHYPSDVLAGAAIGAVLGAMVGVLTRRRSRRKGSASPASG